MEIAMNAIKSKRVEQAAPWAVKSMVAALAGAALMVPIAGMCEADEAQQQGNITFVTGGVSDEALDRLKAEAGGFDLKLVFALKTGAFMSDVGVAITDRRGNTVLNTTSQGPWLLAKLPAGNYQVIASASGNSIKRSVAVGPGKLSTLDFRWDNE
jgi:hypothetical protein